MPRPQRPGLDRFDAGLWTTRQIPYCIRKPPISLADLDVSGSCDIICMTNINNEIKASSVDELGTFIKATGAYVQARDEASLMAVANHSFTTGLSESSASLKKAWTRLGEIAAEACSSSSWTMALIAADLAKDCAEVVEVVAANHQSTSEAKSHVARLLNSNGNAHQTSRVADPYLEQLQAYETRMVLEIEHIQRSATSARSSGWFQTAMVREKRLLQAELIKVRKEIAYVLDPTANKFGHVPFFFRFLDLLAA